MMEKKIINNSNSIVYILKYIIIDLIRKEKHV